MELSGGTLRVQCEETMVGDTHAVNVDRLRAERDGRMLDLRLALVVRIAAGRIAEAWDLFADLEAWDAFWSEAPAAAREAR